MSKIIVTGGCGFIGGHLVDKLVQDGHEVHVIDDNSATETEKFHFNDGAHYHKISICSKEDMKPLFQSVECVFHLAAESRIQPAIQNPNKAYQVNVIGTLNILELCKKWSVKRIVFSSTSSVYGLTTILPTGENTPLDCLNPYSHSKFLAEELCKQYSKIYGMDTLIFRYFNVFGERSPIKGQYSPVVGIFLSQMKAGQPLTIVGDGSKTRDFVHVGDVVNCNILAMNSNEKFSGEIINVGTGENISIKNLANFISKDHVHLEPRNGEAQDTLADTLKLHNFLKYKCEVTIQDWIEKQITNK